MSCTCCTHWANVEGRESATESDSFCSKFKQHHQQHCSWHTKSIEILQLRELEREREREIDLAAGKLRPRQEREIDGVEGTS